MNNVAVQDQSLEAYLLRTLRETKLQLARQPRVWIGIGVLFGFFAGMYISDYIPGAAEHSGAVWPWLSALGAGIGLAVPFYLRSLQRKLLLAATEQARANLIEQQLLQLALEPEVPQRLPALKKQLKRQALTRPLGMPQPESAVALRIRALIWGYAPCCLNLGLDPASEPAEQAQKAVRAIEITFWICMVGSFLVAAPHPAHAWLSLGWVTTLLLWTTLLILISSTMNCGAIQVLADEVPLIRQYAADVPAE